jgi:hypothetical protein
MRLQNPTAQAQKEALAGERRMPEEGLEPPTRGL